jgi:uncharacterized delta-60 repeat protein
MTFYCPSIKQRGNRGPDFAFNLSGLAPRIGLGINSNHNRMTNTLFSRIRNTILRSGKVIIDFSGNSYDDGYSLQLDNIGNIYIAGLSNENDGDFAVIKLTPVGDLDPSFGANGKVVIDISGNSVDVARSLQLDNIGNIYVAGSSYENYSSDFAVIKLDPNGVLVTSFGANGKVVIDISGNSYDEGRSLQLDKLGNIYIAGFSNANGISDFAVIKLTPVGDLDPSFGANGKVVIDISGNYYDDGYSLQLDNIGNIYVAGSSYANGISDFAVIKLDTNGDLDPSFGANGKVVIDISGNYYDRGYSLQLDNIGNIYIAGLSNENDDDFAVIKLDTNGDLDPSFGAGGKVIIDFSGNSDDVARSLQLDDIGNIYVAGSSEVNGNRDDFAVIKLDTNGDLYPSFGANGKVIIDFSGNSGDEGYSLQLDKLGNIYVAGSSYLNGSHDFAVIKLKPNGNLDNTFGKIIE